MLANLQLVCKWGSHLMLLPKRLIADADTGHAALQAMLPCITHCVCSTTMYYTMYKLTYALV